MATATRKLETVIDTIKVERQEQMVVLTMTQEEAQELRALLGDVIFGTPLDAMYDTMYDLFPRRISGVFYGTTGSQTIRRIVP